MNEETLFEASVIPVTRGTCRVSSIRRARAGRNFARPSRHSWRRTKSRATSSTGPRPRPWIPDPARPEPTTLSTTRPSRTTQRSQPPRPPTTARSSVPGMVIAGHGTRCNEKIGEGGMGEVWVAKQTEPVKRKVALKLIKTGMDSKAVLQRFEQERQALALMDHPNIAKVLDGGLTPTGQPFFVMELVNGLPLTKFCDEARLTTKERLELFVPICQAVQHAHQKGIVHRDLKPANILVTMIDGKPVPKVIDFGVAKATAGKLTDESLSTQFGAVVGTLEYMSPEQAGFSGEDIDTRADIYSLGVILYELLDRPAADRRQAAEEGGADRDDPHHPGGRAVEAEHAAVDGRVAALDGGAAADRAAEADGAVARRAGLGGDEVPGEASRPALRDGQRPGPRRPALSGRRAGGGAAAERGLSPEQVRPPAQGAGDRGEPGAAGAGGGDGGHDLRADPRGPGQHSPGGKERRAEHRPRSGDEGQRRAEPVATPRSRPATTSRSTPSRRSTPASARTSCSRRSSSRSCATGC